MHAVYIKSLELFTFGEPNIHFLKFSFVSQTMLLIQHGYCLVNVALVGIFCVAEQDILRKEKRATPPT